MSTRKSKEQVKRFLLAFRLASQKDEYAITHYLSRRKTKLPESGWKKSGYDPVDGVTFEQFVAWFEGDLPDIGDVVWCKDLQTVGLVTDEGWNSFTVGARLLPDNKLEMDKQPASTSEWVRASKEQIQSLQKSLASHGWDWDPSKLDLVRREFPNAPKFVRLMVIGKQVGLGIFKDILPGNKLEMYCVKMGNEQIRFKGSIDLGDADYFSIADTNEEHRTLLQRELADRGYIWNGKCQRLQLNTARLPVGTGYFWINSYQEIKRATENNTPADRRRFIRSNYFRTQEGAIRARNRSSNVYREEMINENLD
jgi:hypothetical protein